MSRVHDALRKAAQENPQPSRPSAPRAEVIAAQPPVPGAFVPGSSENTPATPVENAAAIAPPFIDVAADIDDLELIIAGARQFPFNPVKEALLVNPAVPREAPAEEFRSLRTRLNHLQTLQPLHTLVVTSASPAEGKSFTATNLAVTQAQLAEKRVLLADFDFRRPAIDKTFQISFRSRYH